MIIIIIVYGMVCVAIFAAVTFLRREWDGIDRRSVQLAPSGWVRKAGGGE